MPKLKLAFISAVLVATAVAAHAAGTLRVGMQDDPDALDPARGGTFAGRIVFASLCDKLKARMGHGCKKSKSDCGCAAPACGGAAAGCCH